MYEKLRNLKNKIKELEINMKKEIKLEIENHFNEKNKMESI